MKNITKIAVVGLGGRGKSLIKDAIIPAAKEYSVEISMVFDILSERTEEGVRLVEELTGKAPVGALSYREILDNEEIKGVVIASAWESHIPDSISAMKAGKFVALEVGGAYSIHDCWRLVDTYEETGVPLMFLENCCYGQRELMVLNMVRQGLFGDIVHCEGGYMHDLRYEVSHGKENKHYRLRNYINRNCENYPTHELGPIFKVLDINNGNCMVSLTSTASSAKGLHEYVSYRKDVRTELREVDFAQADIVTTVIKCAKGQTITLTLDTTLPRPYARGFTVRGTKASFFEENDSVFIDKRHNKYDFSWWKMWGNAKRYIKKYEHPLWNDFRREEGHGGMDYHVFCAYFEALTEGKNPPIDVYDAAALMCITTLSDESIKCGSAPVAIPDFTRGKWYNRDDIDFDSKYNLNSRDTVQKYYK